MGRSDPFIFEGQKLPAVKITAHVELCARLFIESNQALTEKELFAFMPFHLFTVRRLADIEDAVG